MPALPGSPWRFLALLAALFVALASCLAFAGYLSGVNGHAALALAVALIALAGLLP
jgi:hypothetical protein